VNAPEAEFGGRFGKRFLLPIKTTTQAVTMTVVSEGVSMRRREFIGLITSAAAWPLTALAQQRPRYPTIAFITTAASKDDVEMQGRVRAFESAWPELGWVEGRNIHVDYRWGEPSQMRAVVAELVASAPDVIIANGTSVLDALRHYSSPRSPPCEAPRPSDQVG
jgi:putative ABC transport system substrate-binding protein